MKKTLLLVLLIGISAPLLQAGAPDEEINQTSENAINELRCSICINTTEVNSPFITKECGHAFHEACINLWLDTHTTCPNCRFILVTRPRVRPPSALRRINALRDFNPQSENHQPIGFVLNRRYQQLSNQLLTATEANNSPDVEILLTQGARPNTPTPDGNTPLHIATQNNNPEIVSLLISRGARPDTPNPDGNTPLHIATQNSNPNLVSLLISRGARPDTPNPDGNTPLHIATQNSNPNLVSLLLNQGADRSIRNADGKTPLDLARENEEEEIVSLLEENQE